MDIHVNITQSAIYLNGFPSCKSCLNWFTYMYVYTYFFVYIYINLTILN